MKKKLNAAAALAALLLAMSGTAIAQTPADEDHSPIDNHVPTGCGPITGNTIYFSDAHKQLGIVDGFTQTVTTICGTTTIDGHSFHMYDIAICPDKTMYGVSAGGNLYEIDVTDATTALVGDIGRTMISLVCDVDGTLYSTYRDHFYYLDRDDGERHHLGDVGNGCRAVGDLEVLNDGRLVGSCLNRAKLLDIDRADGSSAVIGSTFPAFDILGLGSVNPLFGLHLTSFVSQLSTSTGNIIGGDFASPLARHFFFGGATLPSIGACCINGMGTDTPCEELTQWECERNHHAYLGDGSICRPGTPDFCNELYVMMDSKSATMTKDGVVVRWTTSMETDTVGFRVLREVNNGREKTREQVGKIVFSAGNSVTGASYEIVDVSDRADLASAYYIIDIDNYGKETTHGPITIERNRTRDASDVRNLRTKR